MASRRLALGSRVRAKTKREAERVGKYRIQPVLSLDEREGKVGYRYGQKANEMEMKIIAFLPDYAVGDRIIDHLKLSFMAERPPPPQIAYQEILMAAECRWAWNNVPIMGTKSVPPGD